MFGTRVALFATTLLTILTGLGLISSLADTEWVSAVDTAVLFVIGVLGMRACRRRRDRLQGV